MENINRNVGQLPPQFSEKYLKYRLFDGNQKILQKMPIIGSRVSENNKMFVLGEKF